MSQYSIVEFNQETELEIAVVPAKWLTVEKHVVKCWWPNYKTSDKIMAAVQKREQVDEKKWNKYKVRILKTFGMKLLTIF